MGKYFRFRWNDTAGDLIDSWGYSTWFVELDDEMFPMRQVVKFDNGNTLTYDRIHLRDQFGQLGDQSLVGQLSDQFVQITKNEFESAWCQDAINRK